MIKLKKILQEASIPTKIGFGQKGVPDFKHGLVKEFFEFFYVPNGQPIGTFMEMANMVIQKYPEMEPLIKDIGGICDEMFDYLKPPNLEYTPYNLHDLTQSGGAQTVWSYMKKANSLGNTIIKTIDKADPKKIASGLKGLIGILEKGKNIFTSSFGPAKKKRRIGFRF